MTETQQSVLVIGGWHLGSVTASCLASAGHRVHLWDQNSSVANSWKKGEPPLYETGLSDLVQTIWGKNLFWAENLASVVRQAQWIVLAYDTPISDADEVQLEGIFEGIQILLKEGIQENCRFLFTSQLPVGTSRQIRTEIQKKHPRWKGHVLYTPENLRLGQAIESFRNPDRVVLGVDSTPPYPETLIKEFRNLMGLPTASIQMMGLESAEMVKHALNAFLATSIVFANEISDICEEKGANAWEVLQSLKSDSRVGAKAFLSPGLGFAGGTLARDVKTLASIQQKKSESDFFSGLYRGNQRRNHWVLQKLTDHLETLQTKKIVLLGVTYKKGTSTLRRSPAIEIATLLKDKKAHVLALDPMADRKEYQLLSNPPFDLIENDAQAFENADAAVLITEWPQFLELNWTSLSQRMKRALLIDTKNLISDSVLPKEFTKIVPGQL